MSRKVLEDNQGRNAAPEEITAISDHQRVCSVKNGMDLGLVSETLVPHPPIVMTLFACAVFFTSLG